MELIQHAQVVPWSVDAAFFMQWLWQLARTAGMLALFGVTYGGLHRILSNRSLNRPMCVHAGQSTNDSAWANSSEACPKEEVFNEA